MEKDTHFWFATLVRGFIALIAGSAIIVIPDMARTLLLLPIAIAVAILGLAAYGVLDSALIFVSSFMAGTQPARIALRIQGMVGATVGLLLLTVVFERVRLEWFLTLAALQALSIGVGEIVVAWHEKQRAVSLWNYSAAGVAMTFGCAYLVVRFGYLSRFTNREVCWLIYAYLVALGIAQCITAGRMIYADYQGPTAYQEEAKAEL